MDARSYAAIGYDVVFFDDVILGGVVELGYELSLTETLALDVSLRERPAYFISGGMPYGQFNNTLVLGLDLVISGD